MILHLKRAAICAMLPSLMATGAAFADPVFVPPPPAKGHSYPECYCTNRGVKVPIGATSCLQIGSQEFTARCGMSLNNPAWRDKVAGCTPKPVSDAAPVSDLTQPG